MAIVDLLAILPFYLPYIFPMDLADPVVANVIYEMQPGSRYPSLADIVID